MFFVNFYFTWKARVYLRSNSDSVHRQVPFEPFFSENEPRRTALKESRRIQRFVGSCFRICSIRKFTVRCGVFSFLSLLLLSLEKQNKKSNIDSLLILVGGILLLKGFLSNWKFLRADDCDQNENVASGANTQIRNFLFLEFFSSWIQRTVRFDR